MTVVFDAEPLLAFAFGEPGSEAVSGILDDVYDTEVEGYVTTINLAEFRYVAARLSTANAADRFIERLQNVGLAEYGVDGLWRPAAAIKAEQAPSLGDAYAIAAANDLATTATDPVTLVVGADGDFDGIEDACDDRVSLERIRPTPDRE